MRPDNPQIEALRTIMENCLQPQRLDAHPWTQSLVVQQACMDDPELLKKTPGQQLVLTIAGLFKRMMPAKPPRQGKRLDTRWGEFGLLAAQYFAPLVYGQPAPASLRDAWGILDESLLFLVFGRSPASITEAEKAPYRLAGGEIVAAPVSTLSDWNRNGMQRLLEIIQARENFLSSSLSKPARITPGGPLGELPASSPDRKSSSRRRLGAGVRRWILAGSLVFLFGLLLVTGFKGWRFYRQARLVQADLARIQAILRKDDPIFDRFQAVGPELDTLVQNFDKLQIQGKPFLRLSPLLAWVPVYGGDLAAARDLMSLADSLLNSADLSYDALAPLVEEMSTSGLDPAMINAYLLQAQPQLEQARQQVDLAAGVRTRIDVERLSPQVSRLLVDQVDPVLSLMQDGLILAQGLPGLLGGAEQGPVTYLLLAQNEDELRPTGGFITAVGTVLLHDGEIGSLAFEDSENLDDWTKPYPAAPWQLQDYMSSPVLVLRDSNWFTNYPTTALYADTLYSYVAAHSVDGVFAFDQQFLVNILKASGPIQVEGSTDPIDSSNVIPFMRTAKLFSVLEEPGVSRERDYKFFMKNIADALIEKMYSGELPPERLIMVLLQSLNEHHLLIQVDDPDLTTVLVRRHWDGAVRPEPGDFLMVVDTNIGFNKTNALVESSLAYEVDLSQPGSPQAALTVIHTNNSPELICKHQDKIRLEGENYPISDCYWNYLRIYTPAGATLLDSETQDVPAYWMILFRDVPAHVDVLDNEEIEGVQAFGTLQVIPGRSSARTVVSYSLPPDILEQDTESGQTSYHLLVQKQPGTKAVPITIRVILPEGAVIQSMPVGAVNQGGSLLFQADLQTDLRFEIVFSIP